MEVDAEGKGRDLDEESTCQNFKNVARQADISPRHMDQGKSAGSGNKKLVREVPSILPFGVKTRMNACKPIV